MITMPWFYPAFRAGGPVQSILNLVNNYKGCKFFIVCGDTDLNDVPLGVKTGEWQLFNERTQVFYLSRKKRSDAVVRLCDSIQPDFLFIVGVFSWHFNVVPIWFCKAEKKIISARGMLHPQALGKKPLKKKIYFHMWRLFGLQHKATFHATDETEKEIILDFFQEDLPVSVAANYPRLFSPYPVRIKETGSLVLVSIALISPMKNILLVLRALRLVTAEIEYHIYGPVKDEGYWNVCKSVIVSLPVNIRVQYHGEVPTNDVGEALKNAHVFILPSESENFGHAHLEALSAGRPLITSKTIPWLNLEVSKAGFNVDSSPESLKMAIDFFADLDQEGLASWSHGAANYSRNSINLRDVEKQYDELFNRSNQSGKNR